MDRNFLNARFGIEVEFTGISRRAAANVLVEVLGATGFEHRTSYDARLVLDSKGRTWKIVRDGSVETKINRRDPKSFFESEYKVEFVSPILTYQEDMDTLQRILRAFRKAGGCVQGTSGIHIHLDGGDHNAKSIKNFINLVASHNDLLYNALQVEEDRMEYCKELDEAFVDAIRAKAPKTLDAIENIWYSGYAEARDEHYHGSRYHFLNLHSFFHGHGTVELRGFNSTLHAGVVRSYVVLALAMNYQALTAKSVRSSKVQEDNPKFAMRTWLNRIGFIGEEFKNCREHLIKHLEGNAAWRSGKPGETMVA